MIRSQFINTNTVSQESTVLRRQPLTQTIEWTSKTHASIPSLRSTVHTINSIELLTNLQQNWAGLPDSHFFVSGIQPNYKVAEWQSPNQVHLYSWTSLHFSSSLIKTESANMRCLQIRNHFRHLDSGNGREGAEWRKLTSLQCVWD